MYVYRAVDASEAGAGNLEIIVRCAKDGTRIPNYLEADDRSGKFRIYFTPKANCYRYKVDVAFNDQQIHGQCSGCLSYIYIWICYSGGGGIRNACKSWMFWVSGWPRPEIGRFIFNIRIIPLFQVVFPIFCYIYPNIP